MGLSFCSALLGAALASAPKPNPDAGWVKLERSELTKVFGARFEAKVSEPALLATNPEEWTTPFISPERNRLYYGTTSGTLEARSIATGELIWSKKKQGSIGASMGESRGNLLYSTGSSLLAIDGHTGKERWRVDLSGGIGGRMVLTGTVALIPVRPNAFAAVDVVKGQSAWRMKRATPDGITLRGQAAAAVDLQKQRAYLGFSDGTVVAASLAKGETLWSTSLTKSGVPFADVDAQPIIVDGGKAVIAASYAGGLVKLDADTGRILWRRELFHINGLARAGSNGILVAADGDGQALGIYPENGKVRWRYRVKKGAPTEPVWVGRGLMVVGCTKGPVAVLDVSTGRPIQLIAPGGTGSSSPPTWRGPDLALLTNKGLILALRYGSGTGITHRTLARVSPDANVALSKGVLAVRGPARPDSGAKFANLFRSRDDRVASPIMAHRLERPSLAAGISPAAEPEGGPDGSIPQESELPGGVSTGTR